MTTRRSFTPLLLAPLVFVASLAVYARTAAPSVMAGDSAEFQLAAPLLAVPHPSGYPLYLLLARLTTLLPIGDLAYRVTLLSALAGASTAALLALLALRVTGSPAAALIGGVALAVTPGLWNAATIAEVYALNALLLSGLALALMEATRQGPKEDTLHQQSQHQQNWLFGAAFLTGLGISHHASFVFTGAPLFFGYVVLPIMLPGSKSREGWQSRLFCLFRFGCCVCLGLTPWLFILIQYGRLGPFDGLDHGLPRAYFWGAPTSWAEALSHLAGGSLRGKVFRLPDGSALVAVALELGRRLRFEWGALGLALGVLGCWRLLWQNWRVWLGSAWVAAITAIYFASLSQAVQDALVFTLPLLLPWALWVAVGAAALAQGAAALVAIASKAWVGGWSDRRQTIVLYITFTLLLLLTLSWGRSRMPYGNKADQWLFREFGAGALAQVEQGATVMTRWEQGMTLQYLRLAEGSRPDVWIDVSEPEDEPWDLRARRRYPGRPIYIVGSAADADRLGAVRVWGTDYATLFRLVESEKH